MTIESLIILAVVGAIAGWLAGQLVRGFGFGLLGNIIVGIVGAAIASYVLPRFGLVLLRGIPGAILHATIGAVLLLLAVRILKRL